MGIDGLWQAILIQPMVHHMPFVLECCEGSRVAALQQQALGPLGRTM